MTRRIYADNAATTMVDPRVVDHMIPLLREAYGNASSIHLLGQESRRTVDEARTRAAALIGADPSSIIFTSGGTESNNLAIRGTAEANEGKGRHIVTTNIEHAAVREVIADLCSRGFEVTEVDADASGRVDPAALIAAVRPDTILVSLMLANNETGVVQPLQEVGDEIRRLRASGRSVLLHTDAVQAVGKIPVDVDTIGCDLLSFSGHKLHAPKGVGALYVRKGTAVRRTMVGGGQERKLRGGTENVPGIAALGKACELAGVELSADLEHVHILRESFEQGVIERIPDVVINGSGSVRLPGISNISFKGVEGEAVLINLDLRGIAVSTGSACSSGSIGRSHVIAALGGDDWVSRGAVRFSFGRFNTEDEIRHILDALTDSVETLRRI